MMATLSDNSGQFIATAFEDDVCAALEAAAKGQTCGLLGVELDCRANDETPRVTVKRFQPLAELAKRTKLHMMVRVPDEGAVVRLAQELAGARNGNGMIRVSVPLNQGGEAELLVGRDFTLDEELLTRIERITGEGSVDLSVQEPPRLALVG